MRWEGEEGITREPEDLLASFVHTLVDQGNEQQLYR